MATKVKPTRLQITGTPQVWDVPMYVNKDTFQWWAWWWGWGWDVTWPASSTDWDIALFDWTTWKIIKDSWAQLSCYQEKTCIVCDLTWADNNHYPTAKAVADAIQCAWWWDMMKSIYDPNNCNADAFDYCNFSNTPDLNCYQEKLTAWNNITINANTISGDFNYATSSTAAACTTKCVCIPEITQLCVWQQITVKPSVTATNCATSLKLNDFTEYPIRFNNAALTSTTDWYVRWADCLSTFLFDWSYWHVVSKSYDINTTYTLNTLLDAWKYTAWTGTYALSRYSLVMEKDDWTWEKITNTSAAYSTATTKTVNTNWFRLNHIRYYNTTTNVATGALIATNTLSNQAASVDLRYSTNCWWTTTFAEWDYIYLVGTIKSDWLFYLDTTTWWTNALPTTNNWKLYIRIWLCLAANWYTSSFLVDRPIYYYDNGIKVYGQVDNKQDKLESWTNIKTVNWCSLLGSGDVCISVPTDNCELANWCGYTTCTWTLSTCSDITTALWFTPVQSCDIPTDNCQLCNGCWYTTCVGTLQSCDIACINGCCLTSGWNVCLDWLPSQTWMCGKFLTTDGSDASWWDAPQNVKVFTLSDTSDLVNAQAAYDWYANGGYPIIKKGNVEYTLTRGSGAWLTFSSIDNNPGWTEIWTTRVLTFTVSSWSVTWVSEWTLYQRIVSSLPATPDANTIYFVTN